MSVCGVRPGSRGEGGGSFGGCGGCERRAHGGRYALCGLCKEGSGCGVVQTLQGPCRTYHNKISSASRVDATLVPDQQRLTNYRNWKIPEVVDLVALSSYLKINPLSTTIPTLPSTDTLSNVPRALHLHLILVQPRLFQNLFYLFQYRFVFRLTRCDRARETTTEKCNLTDSPYRASASPNPSRRNCFPRLSLA